MPLNAVPRLQFTSLLAVAICIYVLSLPVIHVPRSDCSGGEGFERKNRPMLRAIAGVTCCTRPPSRGRALPLPLVDPQLEWSRLVKPACSLDDAMRRFEQVEHYKSGKQ
eukprot:SAG11_NODE_3236_length_2591_cov_1.198636_3_plen_109_part_00